MTRDNVCHILGWLKCPSQNHGIHFACDDGEWDFWSYERLAASVFEFASGLAKQGVSRNDVVSLVDSSTPEFVISLFSIMAIGAVPSPIAPPQALQGAKQYSAHVTDIVASARPKIILVGPKWKDAFSTIVDESILLSYDALRGDSRRGNHLLDSSSDDKVMLQFSSGSTGRCRGIYITYGSLAANIHSISSWLDWKDSDKTASWLPLYHDMGLVACLITPVVNQTSLMLMEPRHFIRRPLHYLRCFFEYGASLTAMPNFGLEYIVRKVNPAVLEGINFSGWRALIVGAEIVKPKTLTQFHALLAPSGFKLGCMLPAYGLAEATLAVTGQKIEQAGWNEFDLDTAHLSIGKQVSSSNDKRLSRKLISCGRPLDGISVSICDEAGNELEEGLFGEIVVQGATVGAGYSNLIDQSDTQFLTDKLKTNDGGFILNGELFVVGRFGDSVKVRGRAIFAEEIEETLSCLDIPWNRYGVVLGCYNEEATVAVVFEDANTQWIIDAKNVITTCVEGASINILNTPRGTISRTSSGKIKRRQLWALFNQGMLKVIPPIEPSR